MSTKHALHSLGFGFLALLVLVQFFQVQVLQSQVNELTPGAEKGGLLDDVFGEGSELVSEGDATHTLLFDLIANLGVYEANKVRYENNLSFINTAAADAFWTEQGLKLQANESTFDDDGLVYRFLDTQGSDPNQVLFALRLHYDGTVEVSTFGSELILIDDESAEKSVEDLKTYLTAQLSTLRNTVQTVNTARQSLNAALTTEAIQAQLLQKQVSVLAETEEEERYVTGFSNSEGTILAECRVSKLDARLECASNSPEGEVLGATVEELGLSDFIARLDSRSVLQKKIDAQKATIAEVFEDPAFQALLGRVGFSLSAERETDTSFEYSILNGSGAVLRILILDKATGNLEVSGSNGQDRQELTSAVQLLEFTSKKKLWTSPVLCRTTPNLWMTPIS